MNRVFGSRRRIEFEQEMGLQSWIPYYDKFAILIKYIIFSNYFYKSILIINFNLFCHCMYEN